MKAAGATRLIRAFEKLDIPDRGIVSEDLSFCIRWNRCGGQVWAAIAYPISHVGMYDYSACYLQHITQQQAQMEAQAAMQEAMQKQIFQVATPFPPVQQIEAAPQQQPVTEAAE